MTEYATCTRLTASAVIFNGPCVLIGVLGSSDGSNAATLALFNDTDGNTAANKVTPPITFNTASQEYVGFFASKPILCATALYALIGGTIGTGEIMVYWRPK